MEAEDVHDHRSEQRECERHVAIARTFTSTGIFLLFPLFIQAQASSFSVGTATAAPGQKSTGYLEVPAGIDAATNVAVIVINGEKRGPVARHTLRTTASLV